MPTFIILGSKPYHIKTRDTCHLFNSSPRSSPIRQGCTRPKGFTSQAGCGPTTYLESIFTIRPTLDRSPGPTKCTEEQRMRNRASSTRRARPYTLRCRFESKRWEHSNVWNRLEQIRKGGTHMSGMVFQRREEVEPSQTPVHVRRNPSKHIQPQQRKFHSYDTAS